MSFAKKNELKPVDEVEAVVVPRELLHLAHAQIGLRQAPSGEADQRLGRVDAARLGAAVSDQAQERAGAAADVEHAPARLEPGALESRFVGRQLHVLAERPVGRARAPQRSPAGRAACTVDDAVGIAAPSVRL